MNTGVVCHFLLQGIFPTRERTQVSSIAGRFFTIWATGAQLFYFLDFFLWGPFLKSFWICYNIASLLCFGFGHEACEILASLLGIEPAPPSMEGKSLNHWTTREACVHVCSAMFDSLWSQGVGPPGSSVHGIFQARILKGVAISYFSQGSPKPNYFWCRNFRGKKESR